MYFKLVLAFLVVTAFLGLPCIESFQYDWCVIIVEMLFTIYYLPKIKQFRYLFILLFLSIVLNSLSSSHYRGQTFLQNVRASQEMFQLSFFYVLVYFNPSVQQTEKFLFKIILLVLFCWILQMAVFPTKIFNGGGSEWFIHSDKWFRRVYVNGMIAVLLGVFYFLNKFLKTKKHIYLLWMLICTSVYIIKGYRIMLIGIIIGYIYLYIKYTGLKKIGYGLTRVIIFGGLSVLILLFMYNYIPLIKSGLDVIVDKMSNNDTSLSNDSYIRVLNFNYYTHEHFKSWIEYVLGSGFPHVDSPWGKYYHDYLLATLNYNYVDWGLLGLSWIGGIPLVITILLLYTKCILAKVKEDKYYISAWFVSIIIISITDPHGYQNCAFVVEAIAMYLIYKISKENKIEKVNNSITRYNYY